MATPVLPEIASPSTFGGNAHVDPDPVIDDESEVASIYFDRLVTQAAMASITQARAWARVTVSAGVATVADHGAVWGNTDAVKPVANRSAAGVFTVTWATAYDDLQAVPESHSVNIRKPGGSAWTGAGAIIFNVKRTAANVLGVRCADAAGTAADPDEFSVEFV